MAKLSVKYALRRAIKRPGTGMLFYNRHLLGDGFKYQVKGRELHIGTSSKYGAAQHFGSSDRKLLTRPFIGFSEQYRTDIGEILMDHIERLVAKG